MVRMQKDSKIDAVIAAATALWRCARNSHDGRINSGLDTPIGCV